MSRVLLFVTLALLASVCIAASLGDDVNGELENHHMYDHPRVVRSPADQKKKGACESKLCVGSCVLRNGKAECV